MQLRLMFFLHTVAPLNRKRFWTLKRVHILLNFIWKKKPKLFEGKPFYKRWGIKNAITCFQYEYIYDHKRWIIYSIYKRLYSIAKLFSLKPQRRFNFFHAWILKIFIRIKVRVELRKVFEFTPMIHALHNASNTLEIKDILMDWHWIHFKCSFGLTLAAMSEKVRRMMIMERL